MNLTHSLVGLVCEGACQNDKFCQEDREEHNLNFFLYQSN